MAEIAERKGEPLVCWILLMGSSLMLFILEGSLKSYGLLYLELLDKYGEGPQKTGLVGTMFAVVLAVLAPCLGWLVDRFGSWKMLILSPVVGALGLVMSAFAPSIYVVYVGYGIIYGCGQLGSFLSISGAISKFFIYNRTIAFGIMFGVGSMGTIVYPFLFRALVYEYTVRGVLLVLAGFHLNFILVAFILYRIKKKPETEKMSKITKYLSCNLAIKTREPHTITRLFKFKRFIRPFVTIKFISFILYYITYTFGVFGHLMYIPPYAKELKLSEFQIPTLISVFGATDLVSTLCVGFFTKSPKFNIYILIPVNTTLVGVLDLLMPMIIQSDFVYVAMVTNMVALGLLAGGLLGLLGQLVVDAVGTDKAGTGIGLAGTGFGIGFTIPPLIYDGLKARTGSFVYVQYCSGFALILSAIFISTGRIHGLLKKCHKK